MTVLQLKGLDRRDALWALIAVLAFASVNLVLLSDPPAAIEHWYLFYSPLVVAAVRFGLRGALVASIVCLLNILGLYFLALQSEVNSSLLISNIMTAASSVDEARLLAVRIADLNSMDPTAALARAIAGGVLVILGNIFLGVTTDQARNEATAAQKRVEENLGRYFSPQLVQAIVSGDREVRLTTLRKEVTVLFADLRGFTAISERLEPEELSEQLNEYLSAMTDVIFKYDGTLDKYIGDAVMAFFGDPVPHKDHAERALRAALEMRDRFLELRSRWVSEGRAALNMGIGVNTGYVTVGNVGSPVRMEYTVVGSNVNLASRLSDMALADQVLTTVRTYRLVEHLVEGRTVGKVTPEGSNVPTDIIEIVGRRLLADGMPEREQTVRAALLRVLEDTSFRALVLSAPERALPESAFNRDDRDLVVQLGMLRGAPLLQDVPAKEILALVHLASLAKYRRGTIVAQRGDLAKGCYLILSGEIAALALDDEGNERHITSLGLGACFGISTPLERLVPGATVRARSDLDLLVFDRESFADFRDAAPEIARRIASDTTSQAAVSPA